MGRLIINDLNSWALWEEPLEFPGHSSRTIELHINCEKSAIIRVKYGEKKEHVKLLAVVEPGFTKLRVNLEGQVIFVHESEGEVWFYDPVGRNQMRNAPQQKTFTGPMNRIARNPEVEKLMQLMQSTMINQARRREDELERRFQQRLAEIEKGSQVDQNTGEVIENDPVDNGATGESQTSTTGTADSSGTGSGQTSDAAGTGEGQSADTSTPTEGAG